MYQHRINILFDSLKKLENALNTPGITPATKNTSGITNTGIFTNIGNVNINGDISGNFIGNLGALRGMIVMWAGIYANIPDGWGLCDGTTYTFKGVSTASPDLRSRFVIGASKPANSPATYIVKLLAPGLTPKSMYDTSGVEQVALKIQQMPRHNHKHTAYHANFAHSGSATEGSTKNDGDGSFEVTSEYNGGLPDGTTEAHDNMPPYYALAFIIKL
jgi:microcystin-dependent protein